MKPYQRLVIACLLSSTPLAAAKPLQLDPAKGMTQYVISAWRDTSGLPVDSAGSVTQTPDGYLWLATEHGLVRFDGVRFHVFTKQNTPVFRTNEMSHLFVSTDGTLWIGTVGGGAVKFDGRTFSRVPVKLRYIVGFAESRDGAVWIGAPGAVARLRDGKYTTFSKDQGYPGGRLQSLAADGTGVYLALPTGIIRLDDRGARTWTTRDGLSKGAITALLYTAGGLLAATEHGAVDRLNGERFENVFESPGGHAITCIIEGGGGSLWMSTTGGGILRYANRTLSRLTEEDGLTSNSVNELLEDNEGNLWAPTTGGGIVRLKEGKLTTVVPRQPLNGDWILPLIQARDGSVWFATNGGGLNRLTDDSVTRLTTAHGLLSNAVMALDEDRAGSIWVGSEGGLQRISGGRVVQTFTKRDGVEGTRVYCITAARDGSVWVSTNEGLHHIVRGKVRKLTEKDGLAKGSIISIREAADGSLWFAKPGAVEHLVNGKLTVFAREDGLNSRRTSSIFIDEKDGSIWATTAGDGLIHIRNGKVRTYRASDGLLGDTAYSVVQDRQGNHWIPTSRGLYTMQRAAVDRFDAGQADTIPITVFRKADGLKSSDFSGGFDRAGFRAFDGKLWFPTTRGLVVVDPERLRVNPNPPRVLIESVVANGAQYDPASARIDVRGKRQLEISYTSPSYSSPESTTFRYRLEGFDQSWQEAGGRRTAYYTNVPAGTYRFVVQATTAEGVMRETATPLEIVPHFYETWRFRIACVLTGILLALVIHRRRITKIRRHQADLERSEAHFRSLIENASDMILVVGADGVIQYVSPSVSRELGLLAANMSGKPMGNFLLTENAAGEFLDGVRNEGHRAATLIFGDGAGAPREVECVGAKFDDDGSVIVNCRDITDRRRLEAQLEQANRLGSLGRLAATVSHEFNNVLMGIQPFVEIIHRRSEDRTVRHATSRMTESIKRGKRITEEILRYTRPIEPALQPVAVQEWLHDLETEIDGLIGSNIRLSIVAPSGLTVAADVAQLNQVLMNLAINARDAGATSVRLEASTVEGNGVFPFGIVRDAQQFAHFTFTDNGTGIPESVLPNIFEPLFTTKTTRGTGLGLAVAQQVVARHGGELFVESRVGTGTTFHFFLPIAVSDAGELLTGDDEVYAPRSLSCRVLLVEDDPSVADGVVMLLESEGFEVELAITGGEALNAVPRVKPDVVVLDVGLPDMDGVEVYLRIAKRWPDLPVIFSTGHGDLAALEGKLTGPHPPCLLKPYDVDTLIAAVAAAVPGERSVA